MRARSCHLHIGRVARKIYNSVGDNNSDVPAIVAIFLQEGVLAVGSSALSRLESGTPKLLTYSSPTGTVQPWTSCLFRLFVETSVANRQYWF